MAVKSRREEYAALTRAAVLEAAADLFAERGFDATSVDDIASTARASKGAVYHHFTDKRAIFDEVFRVSQQGVMTQTEQAVAALQGEENSPWAISTAAVQGFLNSYVADVRKRSMLRQSAGVLGVRRCREIDDELALPLVMDLLKQLDERGELQPVPREMTAAVIFGTLCEAATSLAFAEHPDRAGKEAAQVVGYLLSGLVKEAS